MTPILEFFSPDLKHLKFKFSRLGGFWGNRLAIRLADLALCVKLESLRITTREEGRDPPDSDFNFIPHEMDAGNFLPQLKSLHSDCCLGQHSLLFEEKPTIVRLVLNCSHVKFQQEPTRKRLKSSASVSYFYFNNLVFP